MPSLVRFRDAVGCGSILGPYGPYAYSGKAKSFYVYSAKNQSEVRQVIERLSPWLGQVKKKQALDAMAKWDARPWTHNKIYVGRKRKPERAVA